jgi:hypothetical protein
MEKEKEKEINKEKEKVINKEKEINSQSSRSFDKVLQEKIVGNKNTSYSFSREIDG